MDEPRSIPSPYHPLHGFRLKLNRAQMHADTLNESVEAWFRSHPYEVYGDYQPGPPEQYVFKVRFLEVLPPEWGIVLGEFAHNARSALDHLAYQVVTLGNGGQHQEQTQFPIVTDPARWATQARERLKGASIRHVEIIEKLQPYNRPRAEFMPEGLEPIWYAMDDPLALLQRLSNTDKHILLNATPARVQQLGYQIDMVRDVESIDVQSPSMGFLLDDHELIKVNIVSSGPNPELRLRRRETIEIGVQHRVEIGPDSYTLKTVPLKESLTEILVRLREIFAIFVNEFR